GTVERRQAELTPERASARRLDVDDAMAQVFVAVERIRRLQRVGRDRLAGDDPLRRPGAREQLAAQLREGHVGGSGDHEVGVAADLLRFGLVADLGAADDELYLGRDARQDRDQPRGLLDVPDVDAEADDPRLPREDALGQRFGARADDELDELSSLPQRAQTTVQETHYEPR